MQDMLDESENPFDSVGIFLPENKYKALLDIRIKLCFTIPVPQQKDDRAMAKVTIREVYCMARFEEEAALLAAYEAGDHAEMGRLVSRRLEQLAEVSEQIDREQKEKYRAEILAEVCAGGEA